MKLKNPRRPGPAKLRITLVVAATFLGSLLINSCTRRPPVPTIPSELHLATDREAVLAAAREIIALDPDAALITVDKRGRPRARTVNLLPSKDGFATDWTIWIATKPLTRKVEQIRSNPNVTLYFNDDIGIRYLTIMGHATLRDDPEATRHHQPSATRLRAFWPDFPHDFVLIEVHPLWLEVVAPGVDADAENWRPQAVRFFN